MRTQVYRQGQLTLPVAARNIYAAHWSTGQLKGFTVDKLKELLAQLNAIDEKIDALLASDTLTTEQEADHNKLVADRASCKASIGKEKERLAREEERETLAADVAAEEARKAARAGAGTGRKTTADLPPQTKEELKTKSFEIHATARRPSNLKNFRGSHGGRSAEERAYRFGMWALANVSQSLPGRYNFGRATQFVNDYMPLRTDASGSNDGNGTHYLVPHEFGTDLIILRETYGVARRLFGQESMTSDTKTIPKLIGGLTAYFPGENGAGTESNTTEIDVGLVAKKAMVLSRWSNELDEDSVIALGDLLAGEISYAFATKEDQCAFNGDGGITYAKIVGARTRLQNFDNAGTDSYGLVAQGTSNTFAAMVLGDFDKVVGRLPQYADSPNACWVMHRSFYYEVCEKLVQASGGVPAYEVREGERRPRPLFKGYPVEFSQVFPSTTAVATVACLLGDFTKGAIFADRRQESIAFSEHAVVNGESVFERDQLAIRGTERFDINVFDVGNASVAGSIVGLRTGD